MRMMYGDCMWLQSNSRSLTWFRGRALLSPCRKLLNLPWNSLASNDDRFISRNQSQAPRRPVGSFSVENHPSEKPATCVLTTWTVGRGQLETEYRAPPEHDPNIKKVSGRVSALNYFRGRFSSQAKLKHTCLGFMKSAPPVLLSQVDVLCQMGAAVLGHVTCLSVCVYLDHTWPLFVNRFVLPFKGSNPPEENQWSCSYR